MNGIWLSEDYNLNDIVMGVAGTALGLDVRLAPGSRWARYGRSGRHAFCTYGMRLPIDSPVTIERANDKISARLRMAEAGVPTVPFSILDGQSPRLPTEDGDWTLKAAFGQQGGGVISRIPTERLAECVIHLGRSSRCLLLEPTLHGPTYRFLVLDGEVIDAYRTAPPRLVGDGRQTVGEQLREFADRLSRGYGVHVRLDFEARYALEVQGLSEEDVVPAGRSFQPTFLSNISRGGEWTSLAGRSGFEIHTRVARAAAGAVGLRFSGVDLIESHAGEVFVLEANPSPGIARFTWPWRADFCVETVDLRVPLCAITAVLRALGLSSMVSKPDLVKVPIDAFNESALRLRNLAVDRRQE